MNLRTLDEMKKENGGDKKKDKKTTTTYAGGQSSGMSVEQPDIHSLMQKAEKNSKTPDEFEKEEKEKDGNVCKITLYQNGFIVEDGDFQDYNDPQNKEFMKELNKGMIPKALREKYPKGGLSVSLSDHTSDKYTPPPPPPPPAYVAFSGSGASLGGPAKAPSSKFSKKSKAQENFILEADKTRQVTRMQVRLADGSKVTMEANLDTPLQLVHNHIATVSGVVNFELMAGFPPKPLDMNSTVQQSDLADGTIIQKA